MRRDTISSYMTITWRCDARIVMVPVRDSSKMTIPRRWASPASVIPWLFIPQLARAMFSHQRDRTIWRLDLFHHAPSEARRIDVCPQLARWCLPTVRAPGFRWCMMKEIEPPNRSIRPSSWTRFQELGRREMSPVIQSNEKKNTVLLVHHVHWISAWC